MKTQKLVVSVKVMWNSGPLRRWSTSKTSLTPMGYAEGGFVGSYVCAGCRKPCDGVYLVREEQRWLCGPCRSKTQPSGMAREATHSLRHLADDPKQDGRR